MTVAAAQYVPDPGQPHCTDFCGGGGSTHSTNSSARGIDWAAVRAAHQARKEAKQQQKLQEKAERQQQAEQKAEDERQRQLEAEQLQRAEQERRQAAFNVLRPEALGDLRDVDGSLLNGAAPSSSTFNGPVTDSDVVDLRVNGQQPGRKPAWAAQFTDREAIEHATRLAAIPAPPPLPPSAAPDTWVDLLLPHAEGFDKAADVVSAAWEMVVPYAQSGNPTIKLVMIGMHSVIAAEDGAQMYLVRRDNEYKAAYAYLKNPRESQTFAHLVKDIHDGKKPPAGTDPAMLAAAQAVANPALRGDSKTLAWDALTSHEAVAAMVRKAAVEFGADYLSDKAGEALGAITGHEKIYAAAEEEFLASKASLKAAQTAEQKAERQLVLDHADEAFQPLFRVDAVAGSFEGMAMGDAVDKVTDHFLGKAPAGEENKE
jgi:hypothetical protein